MDLIRTDIENNKEWKEFLESNYNMFYDYKFISYNDAFEKNLNWHHLMFKDKKISLAIMNGCERDINGKKTYISCDGVSFGGIIWKEKLNLIDYLETLDELKKYLIQNDFQECIIRNPPYIYNKVSDEEYEYALLLKGFRISSNSITNIINLNDFEFEKLTNPKKRAIQKSAKNIEIKFINDNIDEESLSGYYNVLFKNRELKNVRPTHTLKELIYLKRNLSDRIIFLSANINGIIAGICILFVIKDDVVLNFYLAADENYKKDRVSDYILYKSIEWAKNNGFRLYDIGTSNIGNTLLEGLFEFKKKFMANGFLRKTFKISFEK
jgi:lipid II:glycine glycyltransferase (peptidoglycan interpeptide bridge formation enzyme)